MVSNRITFLGRYTTFLNKFLDEISYQTRCRPSKGRRCIPDDVLKNEGSMVQTCQNINVHVVNTDICSDLHES